MLRESGTIVRIEPDALWVETINQTACDGCRASSGCGQRVLGKAMATTSRLRVLLGDRAPDTYALRQTVAIGIPEHVVVLGSLSVYLVPLLAMLGAAVCAAAAGLGDGATFLAAVTGLLAGGAAIRFWSHRRRDDPRYQPVLLDSTIASTEESSL